MSDVLIDRPELDSLGVYESGWHDADAAGAVAQRGINEGVVRGISALKSEPEWMLKTRLKGYQLFGRKPMPTWGADLSEIDFDNIKYFVRSTEKQAGSWEELPEEIRNTQAFGELDIKGTVKGREFSFGFTTSAGGDPFSMTFNGTAESNEALKGSLDMGTMGSGSFTARRSRQ